MTARVPARRPVVTWPALLVAIGLIALAVIGVRDLAVSQGWAQGEVWSASWVERLDGLEPGAVTTTIGVLLALLGLLLVLTVLRPARRTHLLTPSDEVEVWISRRAVSRLAEQATERVPGVHSVSSTTRRRLSVNVSTTTDDAEPLVREAIDQTVGGYLTNDPKISMRKETP